MMKKIETVQDEQGLKSMLTGWYSRLNNLTENEMDRLNEWLEKFKKQVMGAFRQRINIKAADSSQRIFTFFEQLIEKALHRKMRHITADELQQKLRQKDLQKRTINRDEFRRPFQLINMPDLPDELIAQFAVPDPIRPPRNRGDYLIKSKNTEIRFAHLQTRFRMANSFLYFLFSNTENVKQVGWTTFNF